ncbi:MAG: response regulator, partial [Proteobacteria bacterium]|nr:response regulator [Pseudomonadota bacterium]
MTGNQYISNEDEQRTVLGALHLMGGASVALFAGIFFLAGYPVASAIECAFVVLLVATYSFLRHAKQSVKGVARLQILAVFVVTFSITMRLGGIHSSGAFQFWSLISPLAALIFLGAWETLLVGVVFVLLWVLGGTVHLDPHWTNPVPESFLGLFTMANAIGASALAFLTLRFFLVRLRREYAERTLSQQHLKALYDASPDMIALASPEGVIIEANQTLLENLGSKKGDFVHTALNLNNVLGPRFRLDQLPHSPGHTAVFEWQCEHGDSSFPSELRIKRLSLASTADGEQRSAYLTVISDITDRKRKWEAIRELDQRIVEDERQRASRLESLGILAGGIAHDFNNFLTTILGNISLARIKSPPESEVADFLLQAANAVEHAGSLTHQLLTFSKGGTPVLEVTDLRDLLIKSARFALRGSSFRCVFNISADLRRVDCDPGQINQVINNLVINAVQAMPDGGTIEIHSENVSIDTSSHLPLAKGNYVCTTVNDTGEGISEDRLSRIFEPYYTTRSGGSGLGLASAFHILNGHEGTICVSSTMGEGTSFYFYLPASNGDIEETASPDVITGRGQILIMDDDEAIRHTLAQMLRELGYDVKWARDGQQAIDLFVKHHGTAQAFDAVILDLTVPGGMGGEEVVARLHQIDPTIRAIVSTGYFTHPVLAAPREYGFKRGLSKPFNIHQLGTVVRAV